MALLLFLFCCQCWILKVFCCELFYPEVIKVNDGDTLRMKSVYLDSEIYDDSKGDKDKTLLAKMTGRAYCINDICSIPAPTLIIYPGTTIYIQLTNEFEMNYINFTDNGGPEIMNLHSHGLHISGFQDDVFEAVFPSQTISMKWEIHPSHHLGTNWYHAHHHKSTKLQVMNGMHGALIVDSLENKKLNYNKPNKINDYILSISWQFLHDNKYCQNCYNFSSKTGFGYSDSFKSIGSLCSTWCEFTDAQREDSGYNYDVTLNGSENVLYDGTQPCLEAFLVNNLYQPTISKLETNKYFKLRLIQASASLYSQFEFDYNTKTNCQYSLIARDGIALQETDRDLSADPYFGYFLLPPGGRIDVLVMCKGEGIATIYHNEIHPNYGGINESYPMGRVEKQILFKLSIKSNNENDYKLIDPHLIYPEPIYGFPYYLKELIDSTEDETENVCNCSNYNREQSEDIVVKNTNYCALELIEGPYGEWGNGVYDLFEINGVIFNATNPKAIFMISLNQIYSFYVNSDGHPFHIHINPFMVENDLLNGYVAKKNTLMDTLGYNFINDSAKAPAGDNPYNEGFLIKYNARDYVGNIILHCHFLGHEDLGMMGFIKIVNDTTNNLTYCQNKYGFQYNDDEEHFYKNGISDNNNNDNHQETIKIEYNDKSDTKRKDETAMYMDFNMIYMVLSILIALTSILNCFVCFIKFMQNKSVVI